MALAQLQPFDAADRIQMNVYRHGVTSVIVMVFGSFARGEARPDSDLDLLIEASENTTPFFPDGLVADLEEALGRRVDMVETGGFNG